MTNIDVFKGAFGIYNLYRTKHLINDCKLNDLI